jgi:hypothetical protein
MNFDTHVSSQGVLIKGWGGISLVPNVFPVSSQWVPIWISPCSQVPNVFPNMFSIVPHLYQICFGKMLSSFHVYRWAKGEGTLYTSK